MSALKSDYQSLFRDAVSKLDAPWRHILSHLSNMTAEDILHTIGTTSLDVSGVHVKHKQCTFEHIAQRVHVEEVSDLLYLLYGIAQTMQTGTIHEYLKHFMHAKWVPQVFALHIQGEPMFVHACRRSLKAVVEWMIDIMNETSFWSPIHQKDAGGNNALHIAIRRRQWEWAEWLFQHGVSAYEKNTSQMTPLMLIAPYSECLPAFCRQKNAQWYSALHEALVAGRDDATWCVALIDMGADLNQPELYDSPVDSLIVFAKHGMDMNLGPVPRHITHAQLKILYMYGRKPERWNDVLSVFEEDEWVRCLHLFFERHSTSVLDLFIYNIQTRRAISPITIRMQRALENS